MTTSTTALHAAIRAADDNLESAFGQGDSEGISGLYTEGGMLLPTGSDPVKGKPARSGRERWTWASRV